LSKKTRKVIFKDKTLSNAIKEKGRKPVEFFSTKFERATEPGP